MRVQHKLTNKVYQVFTVRNDAKTGFPQFLIYKDNQWRYISAKYFVPVGEAKSK